ncbi:MAG: biopolymer transporter ExbD [Flavobacteriaceae bacterium]|nr:biopolymer transporter ExbD [Flavobacteriaceae bacterium]
MARRKAPEVNAGSMADIAFLLLIFFLVTTTIETDSGIMRMLPPLLEDEQTPPIIKDKNIFVVIVNKNNDLLVEDERMDIQDLRVAATKFLDNGAGVGEDRCEYCKGEKDPESSDNPQKAVISLKSDRESSYEMYMAVQNELVGAYNELRDREAERIYNETYTEMAKDYDDPRSSRYKSDKLKEKIELIKALYPQKLSEAEAKKS